ncbi:hypothetical protein SS50377_20676 [Spironucleus salmonicida]|uniref:Uncharacterized protein n=1 Tax=Spironucleus salmonicida TaxID=348837 RepID=V6LY71_9EUKA|nr:hypothetical protein SS50377_20676 [Spironucleus salmonicida]|eukprot:EST49525.1 Hypothetical protein SS50377_10128 [Spironucleus salmonicida]
MSEDKFIRHVTRVLKKQARCEQYQLPEQLVQAINSLPSDERLILFSQLKQKFKSPESKIMNYSFQLKYSSDIQNKSKIREAVQSLYLKKKSVDEIKIIIWNEFGQPNIFKGILNKFIWNVIQTLESVQ